MYLTQNFVKHRIYQSVGIVILLIISVCFANAQSKKIDNPTPLTSSEILGVIDSDTKGNFYYYSFWANPGEVSIILTVEPGRAVGNYDLGLTSINFKLFDRNAEKVADKSVSTSPIGGAKQSIARVEITKRQLMVLGLEIPSNPFNESVGGKYRIRIDGASIGENTPSSNESRIGGSLMDTQGDQNLMVNILPKKGTLRIKMKDGSIKRIDLSQAEEITVEP